MGASPPLPLLLRANTRRLRRQMSEWLSRKMRWAQFWSHTCAWPLLTQ
jgi:hypothetical protein